MKTIFERSEFESEYDSQATDSETLSSSESTTINQGMRLVGQVDGSHDFYLNGELEGKINITELVKVGRPGRFKGEIKAKNVIIEGQVDGKVTAQDRVEIRDTGQFKGDIVSPSVSISDKAFFQGTVKMTREERKSEETQVQVVEEEETALTSLPEEVAEVETEETEVTSPESDELDERIS